MHTPSGTFVSSVAIGETYARYTSAAGSFVVPKQLPANKHWYRLPNGTKFKFKTFKSGKHGALSVDKNGNKMLFHVGTSGMLFIRDGQGHSAKLALGYDPTTAAANATTEMPNRAALAALEKLVARPGAWTGDDDFLSVEKTYTGNADLIIHTKLRTKSRTRRSVKDEGGGFGDYFGDSGDDGGDSGDGGDGDADACSFNVNGSMTGECPWDLANLVGAVLVAGGSIVVGVTSCFVAGVFTLGATCAGAIAVAAGSSLLIAGTWHAYLKDNCPVPSVTCTS